LSRQGTARYRRSDQLGRFNPDRSVTPVGATVKQVNVDLGRPSSDAGN
jgi:hypothetical protein